MSAAGTHHANLLILSGETLKWIMYNAISVAVPRKSSADAS